MKSTKGVLSYLGMYLLKLYYDKLFRYGKMSWENEGLKIPVHIFIVLIEVERKPSRSLTELWYITFLL